MKTSTTNTYDFRDEVSQPLLTTVLPETGGLSIHRHLGPSCVSITLSLEQASSLAHEILDKLGEFHD